MSNAKKQSFLHGAALLAIATAIVKVIGALYKIPLNAIIGTRGFAYFNTAYDIYSVLLMMSTAGFPLAMSRMISAASSLNNTRQMKRIYRTAQIMFVCLGLTGALLMTLHARQLANFLQQPNAWVAIACLGPSALLVCMISAFRGFFQGQGNMIPTSTSQVIEAIVKLVVGLGAAFLLLRFTKSIPVAAGGAILGVTTGCMAATIYLFCLFRKAYQALDPGNPAQGVDGYGTIARNLLRIAVPITIGSAGLQIITMMEVKVYMTQLLATGFTQDMSDSMKGIYNMTQTIFNLPCAFITPITVAAIPAITSALTLGHHHHVRSTEESASRITALICMPCALGLCVLAEPIMSLLGRYKGSDLVLAAQLMRILAISIIFNSTVMLTNTIMQAHGHVNLPVINMIIGGILKLVMVYFLSGNVSINIVGAPIATFCCYLCITVLNLFAMSRVIQDPPHMIRNILKPLLSALAMSAVVYGLYLAVGQVFTLDSSIGKLMLCLVPIGAGAVVYGICVVKLKAITKEDCLLLPKGEKIANFLHLNG